MGTDTKGRGCKGDIGASTGHIETTAFQAPPLDTYIHHDNHYVWIPSTAPTSKAKSESSRATHMTPPSNSTDYSLAQILRILDYSVFSTWLMPILLEEASAMEL